MKSKWKGALIGGIIGTLIGIFFSWIVPAIKSNFLYCTEIYLQTIWSKCNIISALLLTPKYILIELFGLSGMSEILILIYLPLIGLILGALIGYLKYNIKNEK